MNNNVTTAQRKYYQWLYLYPYVYLDIKRTSAVLYNTYNGSLHEYDGTSGVIKILRRLADDRNLYVIGLKKQEIIPSVESFINDIRKTYSGDVVDTSISYGKPVQFKPILHLQTTIDDLMYETKLPILIKDDLVDFISGIDIYVNGRCDHNCSTCGRAFRFFNWCTKGRDGKEELPLSAIKKFLGRIDYPALDHINILGGNILSYNKLLPLTKHLNKTRPVKRYFLNIKNFRDYGEWFDALVINQSNVIGILVNDPSTMSRYEDAITALRTNGTQVKYHILIRTEKDLTAAKHSVAEYKLPDVTLHPYYDGNNIAFFEKHVFVTKKSISNNKLSMNNIFANKSFNGLHLGNIVVLSTGEIRANVNNKVIGSIARDGIFDVVRSEMEKGSTWRKVRKNVMPCKACAYNAICPPISNYEYVFGRYNLCHIWGK